MIIIYCHDHDHHHWHHSYEQGVHGSKGRRRWWGAGALRALQGGGQAAGDLQRCEHADHDYTIWRCWTVSKIYVAALLSVLERVGALELVLEQLRGGGEEEAEDLWLPQLQANLRQVRATFWQEASIWYRSSKGRCVQATFKRGGDNLLICPQNIFISWGWGIGPPYQELNSYDFAFCNLSSTSRSQDRFMKTLCTICFGDTLYFYTKLREGCNLFFHNNWYSSNWIVGPWKTKDDTQRRPACETWKGQP